MIELQKLGWDWRDNGVILTAVVDGRQYQVFVPIRRVWITFENELRAVGCPNAGAVGCIGPSEMAVGFPGQLSVGGFFDFVKKAVKSAGSVVKKVVPKAVQRAASKVVATAKHYVNKLPGPLKNIPLGAFNMSWATDYLGRKIAPQLYNMIPSQYSNALNAMNSFGSMTLNKNASHLSNAISSGTKAAQQYAAGNRSPAVLQQMKQGVTSKRALTHIVGAAQKGHPKARSLYDAVMQMQRLHRNF